MNSIVGKVERLARNGETELVCQAVAPVTDYNARHPPARHHQGQQIPGLPQARPGPSDRKAKLKAEEALHRG
jgi:hypothetical protein